MQKTVTILSFIIITFFASFPVYSQCTTNAGKLAPICENSAILNAEEPATGSGVWTIKKGHVEFETPTLYNTQITDVALGENVLIWTVTDADECVATDEVTVINNTVNVGNEFFEYECDPGGSTEITTEAPLQGTGVWSLEEGSGEFTNPSHYSTIVNDLIISNINKYKWTVTKANCVKSTEYTIVYQPISDSHASEVGEVCSNSTTIEANTPVYGIGRWVADNNDANFEDDYSNTTTVRQLPKGITTISWEISNFACTKKSSVVIINNEVSAEIIPIDDVCENNDTIIHALYFDPDASGKWTFTEGSGKIANSTAWDTTIENILRDENKIQWTVQKGGCTDIAETIINNYQVIATVDEDFASCSNAITLNATFDGFGASEWKILSGAGNIADKSLYNTSVSDIDRGENSFTWEVTKGRCYKIDTVVVTGNYFSVSIDDFITPTCLDNDAYAVANPDGKTPFLYQWNDENSQTTATASNIKTGVYTVIVTDANNCQASASIEFSDQNSRLPQPVIWGEDTVYNDSERIKYYLEGTAVSQKEWTIFGGEIAEENADTIFVNWHQGGTGIVDLEITSPCGNEIAESFEVAILQTSETAPNQNLITPNGDGTDDFFIIQEILDCVDCFPDNELFIYSMSGVLLYHTASYQNNWDGFSNKGNGEKELPDGTYYYLFRYNKNAKDTVKTGYIVIFRD